MYFAHRKRVLGNIYFGHLDVDISRMNINGCKTEKSWKSCHRNSRKYFHNQLTSSHASIHSLYTSIGSDK